MLGCRGSEGWHPTACDRHWCRSRGCEQGAASPAGRPDRFQETTPAGVAPSYSSTPPLGGAVNGQFMPMVAVSATFSVLERDVAVSTETDGAAAAEPAVQSPPAPAEGVADAEIRRSAEGIHVFDGRWMDRTMQKVREVSVTCASARVSCCSQLRLVESVSKEVMSSELLKVYRYSCSLCGGDVWQGGGRHALPSCDGFLHELCLSI